MTTRRKSPGRDFTASGTLPSPSQHRGSTGDPALDTRISELVRDAGVTSSGQLIEELIISALKIGRAQLNPVELKLINRSVREMRAAARVFAPYIRRRKVVVFGSARTDPSHAASLSAERFGARMVTENFMVITGAGAGIMGSAQKGAGREAGFGLNIKLPFEQGANETIGGDPKLVTFNYFFVRKLTFVKEADAFALFPGGFGTMDEMFEVLTLIQTGKAAVVPIVLVDTPGGDYWHTLMDFITRKLLEQGMISPDDLSLFRIAESIDAAVSEIVRFYRIFHSYRYVGQRLVFRLSERLSDEKLARLNADFTDLVSSGEMTQGEALPAEAGETDLLDLPRLVFRFHRRNFGRVRELIDAINAD